jgi:hypothetical protein
MNADMRQNLEAAIKSNISLDEIVALLRRYKDQGLKQNEAYTFLEELRRAAPNEQTDDRILEVADFVAGFCSPQWRIWDTEINSISASQ